MANFPVDIVINTPGANALGPLNRQLNETDSAATGAAAASRALGAAIAAVASSATLGQLVRLSDSYTKIQNSIVNVVSSTTELTERTGELLRVANQSRSSFEATAGLYGKLKRATDDLGISQERVLRITDSINKGFIASGATTNEASNAITQLAQGLSAGALRGDEFNSVAEQAPVILRAVAQETGKTIGQLREFAATGGITADILIRSIEGYADTIDREFARTAVTFEQQQTVAANLATEWVGSSDAIRGASQAAGSALVSLAENLDLVVDAAGALTAIYGARLIGAIVAKRAATVAAAAATAEAAKEEVAAAAISLRRAEAEKAAAAVQLQAARQLTAAKREQAAAEAQLAVAGGANALKSTLDAANVARAAAAAEVERLRATLSNITAEQALEKQRLAAQISERGRIDTATRMAALGRDRTLLTAQLTAAEKALTATTTQATAAEAALTTARRGETVQTAQLTVSNAALLAARNAETVAVERSAVASAAAAVATDRLTIAQRAAAASSSLLAGAATAANRAMALVGGPVGVAVLAASALIYFGTSASDAADETRKSKLAEEIDKLVSGYKQLNTEGQRVTFQKLEQEASGLRQQLVEANNEYLRLKQAADEAARGGQGFAPGATELAAAGAASERAAVLSKALDDVVAKQQAVAQSSGPVDDAWKSLGERAATTATFYDELKLKLEQQIATIGLTEVEQARLQARQELLNKATKEGVKLTEAQITAYSELAAQAVIQQQRAEADAYILTLGRQVAAERDVGVQAEINANLARLSASATAEQRLQVEALTQSLYAQREAQQADIERNEIRAIGVAEETPSEKLQRELQEKQDLLFNAYYEELIGQEEYEQRRLNLEKEYANKRKAAVAANDSAIRQATAQGLDALAGIIEAGGGKSTKAYRAVFAASRAFALADSIAKIAQAQAQALADPTAVTLPQKIANYAAVFSAGASLLTSLKSPANFADGGYVSGAGTGRSDSIPAFLSDGEFVMPAQRTDQYRSELDAMRRGTFGAAPATAARSPITIINNVADVAAVEVSEGPDGELIATIDRRIAEQTPSIIAQELGDPYSQANKSLNAGYRLERN